MADLRQSFWLRQQRSLPTCAIIGPLKNAAMTERYDRPDLVAAITDSIPLALDEPVILGCDGVDRYVVMSAKRFARLSKLAPDPRRAVSLENMSAEDAAEILAAAKQLGLG